MNWYNVHKSFIVFFAFILCISLLMQPASAIGDVSITSSKDMVIRPKDFTVTISGQSYKTYYVYVKDKSFECATFYPRIVSGQTSVKLGSQFSLSEWNIIRQTGEYPKASDNQQPNIVIWNKFGANEVDTSFASVKTSYSGTRSISFDTSFMTGSRLYEIRVFDPTNSAISDAVTVEVYKENSIVVSSDPSGARIYLDNSLKGITPIGLTGISEGDHQIKLKMDGYKDYITNVYVPSIYVPSQGGPELFVNLIPEPPQSVAEWMTQHTDSDGVVRTTGIDPPIWYKEFEYPQWLWYPNVFNKKFERTLPVNIVWEDTNIELVKKTIQERDEEWKEVASMPLYDVPLAHRMAIFDPIQFWMLWDSNFNLVNGPFDIISNPLGRDHLEMYQLSDGNVVGNAHHDDMFPHKGILLEFTENRIRNYFLPPLWELSYYQHFNVQSDPSNDGWTSVLEYNPYSQPNPEEYTEASAECPVELYAYDSSGNLVASKDYQIPGSYYYPKTDSEPQRIFIFGNTEGYNFKIIANEEDPEFIEGGDNSFTLSVVKSTEQGFKKISYEDVKITENTVASIESGELGGNTVLIVDEGGDGSEKMILPDTLIDGYQAILNHAPTIDPVPNQEVIAGDELTFGITYQDEDEDSLTTSFTTTLPNGDEIAGLPEGATFIGEVFSWTPIPCQGGMYEFEFEVSDGGLKETATFTIEVIVPVAIDIDPDTLNLKSNGPYITTYIELPECYDPSAINALSCCLDCDHGRFAVVEDAPSGVDDYDADGIADMMVKFDREMLVTEFAIVDFESDGKFAEVGMTLTGTMSDGTRFIGEDTIQVRI